MTSPRSPARPALVAAEPFQADDADRPRAEAALALEPVGDRGGRQLLQALELQRAAEPGERRAAAGMQPEPAQLGGREAGEVGGRRRRVQPILGAGRSPDDPPLHRAGLAREDQLAAQRAQQRVGDGGEPDRAQSAQPAHRGPEQRVALEAEDERRVVVVDPEAEAELLEGLVSGRAEADDPVGLLPGDAAAGGEHGREHAVAEGARRIAGVARGERQGVRTAWTQLGADHRRRIDASA